MLFGFIVPKLISIRTNASSPIIEEFVGFNDKIDHAVRIYDHLLQERLNSSYQRRMNATNYAPGMYNNATMTPQTPQTSHIYPQMSNPDSRYSQYVPTSGPYGGTPSTQQTPQTPFQQPSYQQPQQQQQQQQQQQPQQQQTSYPFQPNQPAQASGASNAYNVTTPVAPDQQPYSTAPAQQNQYGVQQQPQQPIQQQPQTQPQQQQQQQFAPQYQSSIPQQYTNGSAAPAAAMTVSSPVVQSSVPTNGQLPISNGYQPMGQTVQSPPPQQQQSFAPVAQQSSYAPYDPQQQQQQQQPPQQQQQQPLQSQAPVIQPQFSGSAQSQYAPYQQQQPIQQQAYAPIAQPKVEEAPLIEL
jgi:growth factor-regulated tyrosine kinase substrate